MLYFHMTNKNTGHDYGYYMGEDFEDAFDNLCHHLNIPADADVDPVLYTIHLKDDLTQEQQDEAFERHDAFKESWT